MGQLIDGKWHNEVADTKKNGGHFKRKASSFRNWVTADGTAGPTGVGGFKAESGRYHLYVSLACPWAHRTLIFRAIKGLQDMISISVVHPYMGKHGWAFATGEGVIADPIHGADYMHQVYTAAQKNFTGKVTVPVLWDRETKTIVSNESAEIIRMLNSAFDNIGAIKGDYYPKELRNEIDALNERIYDGVNNGVYKVGFATTQEAYEAAITPLFDSLDWLDGLLSDRRYLTGAQITEADWRLFTTLLRFDPVYVGHFKCNLRRIVDYAHISDYVRDLYQQVSVAETVDLVHIKQHYYTSHLAINPTRIIPRGPMVDFSQPHSRAELSLLSSLS